MNTPLAIGSRDPAVEDVTNLWVIHPLSRAALAWSIQRGISANMVSVFGLAFGIAAAAAYLHWPFVPMAIIGLGFCVAWLVADGLDGMIARATGTSSAAGRILDGVCDHGVFLCLYLALGYSLGFSEIWQPMLVAGLFHAAQSSLFEAERTRYHRRIRGDGGSGTPPVLSRNPGVRLYDIAFHALDRWADLFDNCLRRNDFPDALAERYRSKARMPMKIMTLLSANTRVWAIFIACLIDNPAWFWWFEIGPLTIVAVATIYWHRRVERALVREVSPRV